MTRAKFTPMVESLPSTVPFVGPETQERARGAAFRARLGANENVFGPSPKAIAAMTEAAPEAWMYGDPEMHDLRLALADHHGVAPAHIMIGEGIDGLLGYLVRLLIAPGNKVVTSDGAYPTFNYHVAGYGGILHKVPFVGDHEDPLSLIAKAHATRAKLIYCSNPDNPMGSWHDAETMQQLIRSVPEGALLVLDEAYGEMAPEGTMPPLDPTDPRVIRLRTFSKAYGLAGLRVGYAIGAAPLISAFNKIRNHFGVGRVAQAAALAALADQAHLQDNLARIDTARLRIGRIAADNGLIALPSATNFVAIDCGKDGDYARRVLAGLIEDGIFVRMPFVAPQDRCIRLSCGPDKDLDAFAEALPKALRKAG